MWPGNISVDIWSIKQVTGETINSTILIPMITEILDESPTWQELYNIPNINKFNQYIPRDPKNMHNEYCSLGFNCYERKKSMPHIDFSRTKVSK